MAVLDIVDIEKEESAEKELRYHTSEFFLWPKLWHDYSNTQPLRWKRVKFTERNRDRLPDDAVGIYSFIVDPAVASHPATKYLLYVGKVQDQSFRQRYRQYLAESTDKKGRPAILKMLRAWQGHLWFYYAPVSQTSVISQLEDDLINAYMPPTNRALPVEVRRLKGRLF